MYAGAGSAPMLAAATGWDQLASELNLAAAGYGLVVSELANTSWIGPASMFMTAAVTPYVTWLDVTAEVAEQTASQARAAAAAYEAAFAMTVPPAVIAANRAQLISLTATNFFGQNTPAIAATEAQYAEMWAQDAAAMYGYAASSALASTLTPFTEPPQTTDGGGLTQQAEAVAQAAATLTGNASRTAAVSIPQPIAAAPQAVQHFASSVATSGSPIAWLKGVLTELATLSPAERTTLVRLWANLYYGLGMSQSLVSIAQQLTFGPGGTTAGSSGAWYPTPQFAAVGGSPAAVSASLARADAIGALSVPPSWTTAVPALANETGQAASVAGIGEVPGAPTEGLVRSIPWAGAGRRSAGGFVHKYGFRCSVVTRPPSAG